MTDGTASRLAAARVLDAGADALVAGNAVPQKDAQITFLPIGVSQPFELSLATPALVVTIAGDAIGNLRFKAGQS